ncbi:hypothetical protein VTK73DRAFT_9828 [Phialemonium thermophilum]|uniref:Uncharacterized protein n=1 Tax=Phialemonium thermophilum TaxID=223376 RepID=A0ABR3W056_9PEZI
MRPPLVQLHMVLPLRLPAQQRPRLPRQRLPLRLHLLLGPQRDLPLAPIRRLLELQRPLVRQLLPQAVVEVLEVLAAQRLRPDERLLQLHHHHLLRQRSVRGAPGEPRQRALGLDEGSDRQHLDVVRVPQVVAHVELVEVQRHLEGRQLGRLLRVRADKGNDMARPSSRGRCRQSRTIGRRAEERGGRARVGNAQQGRARFGGNVQVDFFVAQGEVPPQRRGCLSHGRRHGPLALWKSLHVALWEISLFFALPSEQETAQSSGIGV